MGRTIHEAFISANPEPGLVCAVEGSYDYFHYLCDGLDDRGWGCGYRTLQTVSSWIVNKKNLSLDVPSIPEIQKRILQGDDTKSKQFVGSKEWIGCYEMFLVLDGLFDVPCRLVHCQSGKDLGGQIDVIVKHFQQSGAPIPIGGDTDCSSKAIFGVRKQPLGTSLLVVDPHFVRDSGNPLENDEDAISKQYVRWMDLEQFSPTSFYNLCLPIIR